MNMERKLFFPLLIETAHSLYFHYRNKGSQRLNVALFLLIHIPRGWDKQSCFWKGELANHGEDAQISDYPLVFIRESSFYLFQ